MEKKIVCEFTKRELEALYIYLFAHRVPQALTHDWDSAKAEIRRKLNPNDPTIGNSFAVPVMRWIGERISNAE